MARKSSKTAHVMNLLAGGEAESSKSEAAKENLAASQAAESNGTINELTVLAQQASIQMQDGPLSPSPISIIDLSSSVQDPVAELIKQQLEEDEKSEVQTELPEEKEDTSFMESIPDSISGTGDSDRDDGPSTRAEEAPVMDQFIELSDNSQDMLEETDLQNPDDHSDSDIIDTDEETPAGRLGVDELIKPDIENSGEPEQTVTQDSIEPIQPSNNSNQYGNKGAEAPVPPDAPNFKYLNVMEHVVENIVGDYVARLGGCTCEHCIADVTALTLNKLTPKYVVVEPPAASPLLNFYSSRFAPQVIVELTKSCFIVKENPHH